MSAIFITPLSCYLMRNSLASQVGPPPREPNFAVRPARLARGRQARALRARVLACCLIQMTERPPGTKGGRPALAKADLGCAISLPLILRTTPAGTKPSSSPTPVRCAAPSASEGRACRPSPAAGWPRSLRSRDQRSAPTVVCCAVRRMAPSLAPLTLLTQADEAVARLCQRPHPCTGAKTAPC